MQIVLSSVLVILLSVTTSAVAIRCYICGPGAHLPFRHSKNYDDFHKNSTNASTKSHQATTGTSHQTNSIPVGVPCQIAEEKSDSGPQEFSLECPPPYTGCITEIEGNNRTTRTCEILAINDCKIANNITYCYCNTDLCNGEKVSILTSRAWKSNAPMDISDDEDDEFTEYSSGMDDENGYRKRKNEIKSTQYDGGDGKGFSAAATATCRTLSIAPIILQSAIMLFVYVFIRFDVFTFQTC